MTMRALTLTQPWAGLVASGIKLVENRPKAVIANAEIVRGPVEVAIHASRQIDESVYARIFEIAPELPGRTPAEWGCRWHRLSRITSAVLAVATCYEVRYIGGCSRAYIDGMCADLGIPDQARWMFGPTSYLLRDVRVLAAPVRCRGYQGFWSLTSRKLLDHGEWSDVELAVQRALDSFKFNQPPA